MHPLPPRLSIRSVPGVPHVHVGELRMLSLPKTNFSMGGWQGDAFDIHTNETILRVFENLLINQVLICHTQISSSTFVSVIKHERIFDYFRIHDLRRKNQFGLIEDKLVRLVADNDLVPADKLISGLLYMLLDDADQYANPCRELIVKILATNRLNAWEFKQKKSWFSHRVEVSLLPALEDCLDERRNAVEERCANERTYNAAFTSLSQRLLSCIEKEMRARQFPTDGGS